MQAKHPQGRKIFLAVLGAALLFGAGFLARGIWQQGASGIVPDALEDLSGAQDRFFPIRSIDTMKTSRDRAREKLRDPSFDAEIRREIALIKEAGATHVAIGTPYDEEFIPILRSWVGEARDAGLSVWFRGNFSGWEGWFGYPRISREEHLSKLEDFLRLHGDLVWSGDVFSPCPECENGGPGDPRQTGDADGFRRFLVAEHDLAGSIFSEQGKDVRIYTSMNADIAREIIDSATARRLDGILIDHYTRRAQDLARDRQAIEDSLDAPVGIGEFGAPIPDLHGSLSEEDQARFIGDALRNLIGSDVPIVNYWTLEGGSTSLLRSDGNKKPAYDTLAAYFSPMTVRGSVRDPLGHQLRDVTVRLASSSIEAKTERTGRYEVLVPAQDTSLAFEKDGYWTVVSLLDPKDIAELNVTLSPIKPSLWYRIREFFGRED